MLDAAHDPFVGREDTPLGVTRRRLYHILALLDELSPRSATRVEVLAGGAPIGALEVGPDGLGLPEDVVAPDAASRLVSALHSWAATQHLPLSLRLVQARTAAQAQLTVAEAFGLAGALSEPAREDDAASGLFAAHSRHGHPGVLVRLRERSELLPYPVAAQRLGALRLRGLVDLCHTAARLMRPPGWQSPSHPQLPCALLRLPEATYAVVPGDTHMALLSAPEAELDELFLRLSAPSPPSPGATDAP